MNKIYLPHFDLTGHKQWFVGQNSRHSTATAVKILDKYLLTSHYLARKLYLLDMEGKVITQFDLKHEADLIDYRDGLIVCSNLFEQTISVYELIGSEFKFVKYVSVPFKNLHGVRFMPRQYSSKEVVAVTTRTGIVYADINTGKVGSLVQFVGEQPKDVLFIGDMMITATTSAVVSDAPVSVAPKSCGVHVYKEWKLWKSIYIDGQPDCLCTDGEGMIFITMQDMGVVTMLKLDTNSIVKVRDIEGFDFPHGIDFQNSMMAVSNYGDNSIMILRFASMDNDNN